MRYLELFKYVDTILYSSIDIWKEKVKVPFLSLSKQIIVVIPTYNESKVLRRVVHDVCALGCRVVVVDDGSHEAARKVLQGLPVVVLRHEVNLGQGAAIQTGLSYSLKQDVKVVVTFDSDGQHRAKDIPALVEPILAGKADVVLGSRFLRVKDRETMPLKKKILLRGAVWVNFLLTGMKLSDAHNGLRALSAKAVRLIKLKENGFAHATEIIEQIRKTKCRVIEVPTRVVYTQYSRTKGQSVWNSINIVLDLILRKVL